jgi:DNA polymerase
MTVLHYDIETFSECDLKACGVYKYAEDPSTEMLCMSYRFDKGPVHLWAPPEFLPEEVKATLRERLRDKAILHFGDAVPHELRRHVMSRGETRAHNAQFERVVMNGTAGKKLGFPFVKIEQTVCTAAKAAAAGMPRDLGGACEAAGTYKKNDEGRMSMLQVTKPRKPTKNDPTTRYTPFNAPEKFVELYVYNVDDTIAESELDAVIPDLTPYEQQVYWLDQRINERGVAVDLEAIANVKVLIAEYKDFLEKACEKATRPAEDPLVHRTVRPEGLRPTQREKIADWVRANGYPDLLDMQAETIKLLVERDDVPGNVKHVLRIYSTYNAKAVTKFDTILEAVCLDGRLHGMLLYHGAGTGRWSSLIVQLQNLFRPVIDDPEIAVEAFRSRNLSGSRRSTSRTS